jgi:hypothetical protein
MVEGSHRKEVFNSARSKDGIGWHTMRRTILIIQLKKTKVQVSYFDFDLRFDVCIGRFGFEMTNG